MQKQVSKIIVVMGPTSSGKSSAALELAKKFNGEIISADSRQVYRKMNIGTGKVPGIWSMKREVFLSEKIPHHLIDVADPMEDFNVSHFKTLAEKAIVEILGKGKVPIICGGTGFWIDAVVKNVSIPEVAPDPELREILEKQSLEELFLQLQKLDPERANNIDSKNKVRLVRAIEICKAIGKVPNHKTWSMEHGASNKEYNFLQIGIKIERKELNEKIQKRLDERFDEGMITEVQSLHENGTTWQWMERIGLEYRWVSRFLQDQISEKEMREKLYFDIIHYAKRQMTWLKRNKEIIWIENYSGIENEVAKFLKK
ncbi:MAG: tRNA (adenosine(37)-N6)-dimethylallyltransferase MiaA [Candidatus Moranbacteria bacterium]|nr:tRNA (adenosine(37)-N6)-dimethylallyltransferase MiaA [Candidatus Moranbacteria bacterium]